jgi:hypothetical protein
MTKKRTSTWFAKTFEDCRKRPIARLRPGVRWQAERDTAFEGVTFFKLDVLPDSKAVSQPPHSRTLRRIGRLTGNFLLTLMAAVILSAAPRVPAQQFPIAGGASDFNSVEYYGAPHQQDIKRLFSGAEAQPLPGGLLLVKKVKIELFDLSGKLQLVAEAPECVYDPVNVVANSPGEVHVHTGDGQLKIEGEGFLWRQNDSLFTISNQVQTVIERTSKR